MKIQVVRVDGSVEVINLLGTVTAYEPGSELPYPRNQSPLHVAETGMDYFFREDGRYDGWGMGCNIAVPDGDPTQAVSGLIEAIESDREIIPKESHD